MPIRTELRHLIEEIGGPDQLRKIVRSLYDSFAEDEMIGFFFEGRDLDLIAKHQAEFILAASGLVEVYTGRLPVGAHLELPPILRGHFDRRLVLIDETLAAHGLSAEQIQVWLNFENAFRSVITREH